MIQANDRDGTVSNVLDSTTIAALRKADDVVFRFSGAGTEEAVSYIRAIRRAPKATPTNPFPQEVEVRIPCDSRITNYESEFPASKSAAEGLTGFALVYSYEATWTSLTKLLRPGDVLSLLWERGAYNTEATKACVPPMFGDRLSVRINRADKKGHDTSLTFTVDQYFGPDNTARMIRS